MSALRQQFAVVALAFGAILSLTGCFEKAVLGQSCIPLPANQSLPAQHAIGQAGIETLCDRDASVALF